MEPRGARRRLPWLIILLAFLAFGQAIFLFPLLFGSRGGAEGISRDVNLPEREVRVFLARGDPALIMKSVFDLPEADRNGGDEINRRLFPGGEQHRYFLLHAIHGTGDRVTVDMKADPLTLEDGDGGVWPAVDLEAAFEEQRAEIPAYLGLFLRSRLPREGRIYLSARGRRTVLVAFRAEGLPERLERARIGDRVLKGVDYSRKDELDRQLERPALLLREDSP